MAGHSEVGGRGRPAQPPDSISGIARDKRETITSHTGAESIAVGTLTAQGRETHLENALLFVCLFVL